MMVAIGIGRYLKDKANAYELQSYRLCADS